MRYIAAFALVFAVVSILIPRLMSVSARINFVDRPTKRKVHGHPIPLLGGGGIFAGFLAGWLFFVRPIDREFIAILASSLMILGIGLVDDWYKTRGKEFSVLPRLAVQIAAAIIVYSSGIVFRGFTNPFTYDYIRLPGFLQFVLTITWLLGVLRSSTGPTAWTDWPAVCPPSRGRRCLS